MSMTITDLCLESESETEFTELLLDVFREQSPGSLFSSQNEDNSGNVVMTEIVKLISNVFAFELSARLDKDKEEMGLTTRLIRFNDGQGVGSRDFTPVAEDDLTVSGDDSLDDAVIQAIHNLRAEYIDYIMDVGFDLDSARKQADKLIPLKV